MPSFSVASGRDAAVDIQFAPVIQPVAWESGNVVVLAGSWALLTRPSGWQLSKLCGVSSISSYDPVLCGEFLVAPGGHDRRTALSPTWCPVIA
jgi:hypothetical protein